ncbi:hypothetical protein B1L94_10385, partial [Salmonella enterica subsp. enterica serovar Dublin]
TLKIFIPAAMFARHKSRRLIQSKSLSHQALLAQPVWTLAAPITPGGIVSKTIYSRLEPC